MQGVTAELPSLDEGDFELNVENNTLTLKGEKRTETEDKERQYSERYHDASSGRPRRCLPRSTTSTRRQPSRTGF